MQNRTREAAHSRESLQPDRAEKGPAVTRSKSVKHRRTKGLRVEVTGLS